MRNLHTILFRPYPEWSCTSYKKPPVFISLRNLQEVVPILKMYCISDTILVQSLVGCDLALSVYCVQQKRWRHFTYFFNSCIMFLIISERDTFFFLHSSSKIDNVCLSILNFRSASLGLPMTGLPIFFFSDTFPPSYYCVHIYTNICVHNSQEEFYNIFTNSWFNDKIRAAVRPPFEP